MVFCSGVGRAWDSIGILTWAPTCLPSDERCQLRFHSHKSVRRSRAGRKWWAAVAALSVLVVSGCAGDSRAAQTSEGETRFETALARVAGGEENGRQLRFVDAARLTDLLAGGDRSDDVNMFQLLMAATGSMGLAMGDARNSLSIDLQAADYVVAAGGSDAFASLVAGGQDGKAIADILSHNGWEEKDGLWQVFDMSDEEFTDSPPEMGTLWMEFWRVALDGDDVSFAGQQNEKPLPFMADGGKSSLTKDPHIAELADCLGDVAAAVVLGSSTTEDGSLTGIAAGVSMPENLDEAPHPVVCTTWKSEGGAKKYLAMVESDTQTAESSKGWHKKLTNVVTAELAGDEPMVRWEADGKQMPASWIIDLAGTGSSMPGLPGCDDFKEEYSYGCWTAEP